jgi:beta-mannosidase
MKMRKIDTVWFFYLIMMVMATSCGMTQEKANWAVEIDGGWEFSEAGTDEWLPATVPGTVHADLLANGKIEDPHFRMNEDKVQWIEDKDWVYRTTFKVKEDVLSRNLVEMEFLGLDTYADVYLNDSLLLSADNMFLAHVVDVKAALVKGENKLRIYFHSPVARGMEKLQRLDYLIPAVNEQAPEGEKTNVFTRKAPFHYGWDWGPRLVTSGVWRPVVLRSADQARIEDVFVETISIANDKAQLRGFVEVQVLEEGVYDLSLTADGETEAFETKVNLSPGLQLVPLQFDLLQPKLWWSNGLGDPYLYDFRFELKKEGKMVDAHTLDYGVRTIELVQTPDEAGRSFHFEVNGVPVFMKGANVIPSNTLTPSVDKATYDRLIRNAVDANMNMLRVWGGAIYEEDYFYELCDRNGILIWQDFMFACALQPGDEAHLENIRLEAEYNVKRLRNHASLALWCGNNENLHGLHHWWNDMFEPEVEAFMVETYNRIFLDILPAAVEKHHPGMDYWSTSPSAFGDELADRRSGDEHDWTIWFGEKPFSAYAEDVPRFVSEYGLQAFPGMHTIKEFTAEEDRVWDSEVMRHRQRGTMAYVAPGFDGNDMIRRYMERYYKVPEKFEDFVYVSQLLHAKAYKTALEAHRRNMPHCMGSLYWQINDSWPTISWATVDFYGRWKAAHYAVRKANETVIISPVVTGNRIKVFAVSDRLEPFSGELKGTLMGLNGTVLLSEKVPVTVAANTSTEIFEDTFGAFITPETDISSLVVVLELLEKDAVIADNIAYMVAPKDLPLAKAEVQTSIEVTEAGYALTLTCNVLAKDVFVDTPYGDVFVTDNYFDLVPGRPKTIELITDRTLDLEKEVVIKTLNDLN